MSLLCPLVFYGQVPRSTLHLHVNSVLYMLGDNSTCYIQKKKNEVVCSCALHPNASVDRSARRPVDRSGRWAVTFRAKFFFFA